jgi:intracellular septation protein
MNPQIRRLLLDLGPLVLFFAAFHFGNILIATGVFMAAVVVALGVELAVEKRASPMLLFTAAMVLIFGGLTLYLKNDVFIKIKPTVIYTFFGATLLGGLFFNRLFIKYVFAQAYDLTESAWRQLTWRYGIFFLALAVCNEIVWRHTSTATWVAFKVWGIIPLIFLFALAQTPFILKHHVTAPTRDEPGTE